MMAAFIGVGLVGIAGTEPGHAQPAYPFSIQRSVEVGESFSAANGRIIYTETSAGSLGTFVLDAAQSDDWPIKIETSDLLQKFTAHLSDRSFWGVKVQKAEFHCPEKFGDFSKASSRIEGYPTICLVDTDQDQAFDSAVRAYGFGPLGLSHLIFRDNAEKIPPVRYAQRIHRPDAGKEAIIELRYDGLKGDMVKLTALARSADSPTPVYERQIELPRAATSTVVIEHPILGSPGFRRALGYDKPAVVPVPAGSKPPSTPEPPRPIPTMTIAVSKADAKSISGTVVSTYTDWVWHREPCLPVHMPLGKGEKAREAAPTAAIEAPKFVTCEGATWRDGTSLISTGPAGTDGLTRTTTMTNERSKP